ncbi:hypothetical protein DY000_02007012 [Brassica cretica]|uniref:Uncharacterized protein n=1 Tax=Brassica cretica TaxID=69181 RepID=A0ABQ7CBU8_BRACR|nr:hypothetical protein DY000_02007012 [Brassica cretica]
MPLQIYTGRLTFRCPLSFPPKFTCIEEEEMSNRNYSIRSDLEISDDFEAFWRYLEQAPEMDIELDHRSILEEEYRSMFTLEQRSTAKRAESLFGTCLLGKNTPVSFPPASRQNPDPRVPDKGTLRVPARRNPELGPWNRAPFQEIETFRQGKPFIFPNMEEFNLMKLTPRRLYKSY